MNHKIKEKYQIIKENIAQKDFSFLMLVLSVFLLPFSINFSTFIFILSFGLKVVQVIFKKNRLFNTKALRQSSMIGAVFLSYIIINAIIQTSFIDTINVFEKQFSHWTLLFLTPMLLKDKKTNTLLVWSFFIGVITTIVWVALSSAIKGIDFNSKAFLDIVDIHHTYLALYILFIINFIIIRIVKNKNYSFKKTSVMAIAIVSAFAVIFVLGSKIAIIIFTVLFVIHFIPEFSKNNVTKNILIFVIVISGIFVFNKKLSVSYESALDFRTQIWDASIKIIKENTVFGNLNAPEKELLNYRHYLSGKYYFLDSDLNSHNQYLSIVLKYGIFGFMLISFFVINIFKTINKKTSKYKIREIIGFAVILGLTFYIENILDRHHGIMFFAIFYNYYLVEIEIENEEI
jgi:O-antigen ligase